jgi:peptidoglycan/xylan/chitin deacetylase (PgdA/CDA1 family)
MVGALADWFAVTALFRHPLGLPIPHTAIIPNRKDQIGRSLGEFVETNFLTQEVLGERLQQADIGRRLGTWLAEPANAQRAGEALADALKGALEVLDDEEVHHGHELVAHCYAQDIIPAQLSPEQVKADIARTTAALEAAAGQRPRGWVSPRGTPSAESARLLAEAGYVWQGDVFDDDRPYLQSFDDGTGIIAIPLTMEVNDLPHAMRFGRSPGQFVELFDEALGHMLAGEDEAVILDATCHAHVYGRPTGAWAFEEVARKVKARDDVFLTTRNEIAALVGKPLSQ